MTTKPLTKAAYEEDENQRVYRNVAFATTDYVGWVVGSLRITAMDTQRLRTSGVPVLLGHQGNDVVGRVLNVRQVGDVWRSDYTMPKIGANRDTFERMDSCLLEGISVGAQIVWTSLVVDNQDDVDDLDDLLISATVVLVEQSLTPIPADVRAGLGRSLERQPAPDIIVSTEGIIHAGKDTAKLYQRLEALARDHNQNLTLKRQVNTTMTTTQIPPDVLQRAVADEMARNEALQKFTSLPGQLDTLIANQAAEEARNMEYRAKLDKLQFQPSGQVSQMSNWNPNSPALNIGRILRLTADRELGFPQMNPSDITLEESFLERTELAAPDRATVARVPFEAVMERTRQRSIQRSAMADAAGARPAQVNILGDAGLLFNDFAPILAAMDVKMGLRGSQKVPFFTAQGSAAGGAEAADIPISTYTMNNEDLLPVSIASAFDLSSSLQAIDDGSFESLVRFAIFTVCNDEMTAQVLDGGGSTANQIAGLWARVSTANPDHQVEYGAAQTDFGRSDILSCKNLVDLAKTDGGPGQWILGSGLYQLAENTLRGGTASERYLLEDMMLESRMVHHYADFLPSGTNDAGLFGKLDRITVLIWGDSFMLQEIPVRARKNEYKMTVECNVSVIQPNENLARIARN